MARETIFTLEATPIKFGPGAVDDAGWELSRLGVTRALLVTDPGVPHVERVARRRSRVRGSRSSCSTARGSSRRSTRCRRPRTSLGSARGRRVRVGRRRLVDRHREGREPDRLASGAGHGLRQRADRRRRGGARSAAARTWRSRRPAAPAREATTVAVLDIPEQRVKTGISHRYLRPSQAIVDPALASSLPAAVVASAGLDVVCHAAESFLSLPFVRARTAGVARRAPAVPGREPGRRRVVVEGAGVRRALPAPGGRSDASTSRRAGAMMLAASMAGVGFGSAGVHIPHACAYPIAGLQAFVCAAGLSGRPSVRPARDLGDRHRAGGVPVHVPGRPRAATSRRPRCWAPPVRPGRASVRAVVADGRSGCAVVVRPRLRRVDIPELVEGARAQARLLAVRRVRSARPTRVDPARKFAQLSRTRV